jgi:hypothetical protein
MMKDFYEAKLIDQEMSGDESMQWGSSRPVSSVDNAAWNYVDQDVDPGWAPIGGFMGGVRLQKVWQLRGGFDLSGPSVNARAAAKSDIKFDDGSPTGGNQVIPFSPMILALANGKTRGRTRG